MPPSQMWCERDLDGREIARLAGAQSGAPQELEQSGLRKFRRAAGAAVDRIDDAAELTRGVVELGGADRDGAGLPRGGGQPLHQRGAIVLDLLRLFAEQPGDLAQHVDEGGPAVARGFGK